MIQSQEKILELLKKQKTDVFLSTYEVAKVLGISWSTANSNLFILLSKRLVKGQEVDSKSGTGRKYVWKKVLEKPSAKTESVE